MSIQFIKKLSKLSSLYLITILFFLTFFCYANTLGNGLFFDDEQFIYNNQFVKTFDVQKIFSESLISGAGKESNYFRPILFLGFSIEYHLFGNNGFIYHLNSFLIHFAGGIVLFFFLQKLFHKRLLSFLTSLLFLIHPIQTEAVSYASGRGDPLSFLFCMLTLYFSLSSEKKAKILSFLSLLLALLSKEIALMLPGLLLTTHYFFNKHNLKKAVITTIPYALITLCYFFLRITVFNFANTLNFYNSKNIYSSNIFVRINTFINLFPTYLHLLAYPKNLFMERDSGISIFLRGTITTIIVPLCLLVSLIFAYLKREKNPIVLFSLSWIGISFIPTSGLIPINGIFYEHFLYFPSVGFFLLFSYIIYSLYKKNVNFLYLLLIPLAIYILFLMYRTITRNQDWHDPIKFYLQTIQHVQSPRAYNNLAMAYAENGDSKNAIITYKKAISLVDAYPESRYNLGNSYLSLGNLHEAEKEYRRSLEIDPSFYLSYIKLYAIYKQIENSSGIDWIDKQLDDLGEADQFFMQLKTQLHNQ
ncbi:MAG: tetratricopeptide repeat protein [Candidatus Levybacteria bacterium]|nr:tetratricopeptide repeat protein [Candidatus Levybacteria bacterium]